MKKVKIICRRKMPDHAWEAEGKPSWWIRYTNSDGIACWPPHEKSPGNCYLEAIISVPDSVDYVFVGVGKCDHRVRDKIAANRIIYTPKAVQK